MQRAASPRDGLMTAPRGARLPRSTAMPAFVLERLVERLDHVAVRSSARRRCSRRCVLPLAVSASQVQQPCSPISRHHRRQAAGVAEVLHQVLARRLQVHAGTAARCAEAVPVVERRARTPMRPAIAIRWITALVEPPIAALASDRVLERLAREDLRQRQVLVHHLDDAPAGHAREHVAARVDRRDTPRCPAGRRRAPRPCWPSCDAVPIVMQWPCERCMQLSASRNSSSVIVPARTCSRHAPHAGARADAPGRATCR